MKVNGIDIRKYNAKQLTAEVLPPSISVDYEIITGAALPAEFDTDMPLGTLKLCLYFRGKDRNNIIRNMSDFLENFGQSSILQVDGYKGYYKAFVSGTDYTKLKVKDRYKLDLELKGYFYDTEKTLLYDGVKECQFERMGSRKCPAVIEITAKNQLNNYTITGLTDIITVENLQAGKTLVIDGENGTATIDGINAFDMVSLWQFPALESKDIKLTFSSCDAAVKIRYKPMWL